MTWHPAMECNNKLAVTAVAGGALEKAAFMARMLREWSVGFYKGGGFLHMRSLGILARASEIFSMAGITFTSCAVFHLRFECGTSICCSLHVIIFSMLQHMHTHTYPHTHGRSKYLLGFNILYTATHTHRRSGGERRFYGWCIKGIECWIV